MYVIIFFRGEEGLNEYLEIKTISIKVTKNN